MMSSTSALSTRAGLMAPSL